MRYRLFQLLVSGLFPREDTKHKVSTDLGKFFCNSISCNQNKDWWIEFCDLGKFFYNSLNCNHNQFCLCFVKVKKEISGTDILKSFYEEFPSDFIHCLTTVSLTLSFVTHAWNSLIFIHSCLHCFTTLSLTWSFVTYAWILSYSFISTSIAWPLWALYYLLWHMHEFSHIHCWLWWLCWLYSEGWP